MKNEILEKLTVIENLLKGQTEKPLTFNEAAAYLDVSKSHLYKLTSSNRISHYKPQGKRVYFSKSELDAWLLRGRVSTQDEVDQKAVNFMAEKR